MKFFRNILRLHYWTKGSEMATGSVHMDMLNTIMANTPLSWPSHTVCCFPAGMAEFFSGHPVNKDNKHQIKVNLPFCFRPRLIFS